MHSIFRFFIFFLVSVPLFLSCKSSKMIDNKSKTEENLVKAQKIEEAKRLLNPIVNQTTQLSKSAQQDIVDQVKAMGIEDKEIVDLIKKAQDIINNKEKTVYNKQSKKEKTSLKDKVDESFYKIANAKSINRANQIIKSTLRMFASKKVTVLTIISSHKGIVDYDKPKSIEDFLNSIKDRREVSHKVQELVKDDSGKIRELVLILKKNR